MSKSRNQKLKLLYLARILLEKTDEAHPMTVQQMIDALAAYHISAERKAIYDDLELLSLFGLDVIRVKAKRTGYYIGRRRFELPELKLLVDSVQSSRFITQAKTLKLIQKIEGLASCHEARLLQRQVYVRGRVKSMNESVYYNVDAISGAITRDRVIRFQYFEYTSGGERRFRRGGDFYEVSPYALIWDDENYYMLAWEETSAMLRHYRVDKMTQIGLLPMPRRGAEAFAAIDMSGYTNKVFSMFGGVEEHVRLRLREHLAGAVIDRFGKDLALVSAGEGYFTVGLDVVVSPQFFAWVFGFGADAEVLEPPHVREEMRRRALNTAKLYAEE